MKKASLCTICALSVVFFTTAQQKENHAYSQELERGSIQKKQIDFQVNVTKSAVVIAPRTSTVVDLDQRNMNAIQAEPTKKEIINQEK